LILSPASTPLPRTPPTGAKTREECSTAKQQARRKRPFIHPELKAEAESLCRSNDRTITQVANELDLAGTALHEWLKRADAGAGEGASETLTSGGRDELRELRKRAVSAIVDRMAKSFRAAGGEAGAPSNSDASAGD
jgi:transposase-like protein